MRRLRPAEAKVIGRIYQAGAKMIMPNPVGHHAAKEWIGLVCNPIGQPFATLSVWRIGKQTEVRVYCLDCNDAVWNNLADWFKNTATVKDLSYIGIF